MNNRITFEKIGYGRKPQRAVYRDGKPTGWICTFNRYTKTWGAYNRTTGEVNHYDHRLSDFVEIKKAMTTLLG